MVAGYNSLPAGEASLTRMRYPRLRAAGFVTAAAVLAASCGSSGSGSSSKATSKPNAAPKTTAAPAQLSASPAPWRLPGPVSRPVVVPDGSGFDILGGLGRGDLTTGQVVRVNPAGGTAQPAGTLAVPVHDSAGASIGGHDFVFGGGSANTVPTVQSWSGAGKGNPVGRLPENRSDLATATDGTTTYVLGGFDGTKMTPDVLATTDGTTFRPVGNLAVPVRYPAVAYAGGAIWVVGGVTSTGESGPSTSTPVIQKFDPATGKGSVVGQLPQPMGHATAVVVGGQVFVLGGRMGTAPNGTIYRLNTSTGAVQPAGNLPQPLSDAGSIVLGDTAYLVGGEVTGPTAPLDTVEILKAG